MGKFAEWLIDRFHAAVNAPFRKRSKVEKALIRRMLRHAEQQRKDGRTNSKPPPTG